MKTRINNAPISEYEINWEELAAIGILKDELELDGHLDTLLRGEKTETIFLRLTMMGVDMEIDATLQFIRNAGKPVLEIIGIQPFFEQ